jgi:transposase
MPEEVMDHIRPRAVHAIRKKGYSPERVADILGFSRSAVYEWLNRYDRGGYEALESRTAPGAEPNLTPEREGWLKESMLTSTPPAHGYETVLWTRDLLAELVAKRFGVVVRGVTVSLPLKKLNLPYPKPAYRDRQRDEHAIERFLTDPCPRLPRLAQQLGADIGLEDEAGVALATQAGRTWGLRGHPPLVPVTMQRGGYNVLSVVLPQGTLRYSVTDDKGDSEAFIAFRVPLIRGRERPLILNMDQASLHHAKKVRDFVRAHRRQRRVFFLPKRAPELNPDAQVWNEIKNHDLGKRPLKTKRELRTRLYSKLRSLQRKAQRIQAFFRLPDTRYAAENV